MTAYEVIQQHPEWVENPTTPRKQITEAARRYVRELDGGKHFNALIIDDVERLLKNRGLLKKQIEIHEDLLKESTIIFNDTDGHAVNNDDYIVSGTDGHEVEIKALETAPDYIAAERKVKIYAIFIKAIIAELNGKAICAAAQIQEWRERYGVKLEGLQGKSKKKTKEFEPIGLDEKRAIRIYNWAFRSKRIECTEDDFIWYFGKKTDRTNSLQPNPIKWNGKRNELAYLCGRCADFTKPDKKEYITDSLYAKSRKDDTKWKGVYAAIFGLDENERIRTQRTLSRIKRGSDNAPGCWNEIDALFK